jgi:hypothetical protein
MRIRRGFPDEVRSRDVATEESSPDLPGIPLLLREARGAFAQEIRSSLVAAGLPALPVNGPLVLGGLHQGAVPFERLVGQRARSMQRNQTVEQLFASGYLEGPSAKPTLTNIGHEAAHVVMDAVQGLTDSLRDHLGEEGMRSFTQGLLYLTDVKESREAGD